jgi:hypothetical protein
MMGSASQGMMLPGAGLGLRIDPSPPLAQLKKGMFGRCAMHNK